MNEEMQPCAGRNCGSTNPNLHSAECFEDYEKATGMAQPAQQEPEDYVRLCPQCEYNKNRAARWRAEAYKQAGHEIELPWVGLTEEDMGFLFPHGSSVWVQNIVKIIEAKLKEKNS